MPEIIFNLLTEIPLLVFFSAFFSLLFATLQRKDDGALEMKSAIKFIFYLLVYVISSIFIGLILYVINYCENCSGLPITWSAVVQCLIFYAPSVFCYWCAFKKYNKLSKRDAVNGAPS